MNQLNRLMAIFLKNYPGYTRETMLEEYAVTVMTLINEAIRLDAQDKLANIQANALPQMSKRDVNSIIEHYKQIIVGKREISSKEGIKKLKELMR